MKLLNRIPSENPEEDTLKRAKQDILPKYNYDEAVDMDISPIRNLISKVLDKWGIKTGLSNCTLTATQWVNPNNPIGRASTIVSNPNKNGFQLIDEKYAIPGTLIIASKNPKEHKKDNVYHSMILSGFADKDYDYEYQGLKYNIKKGEPLVTYSKGKNDIKNNYRRNIPLKVYNDQSEGKIYNRYYKPLSTEPNVLLPEIIITGK